MIAEAVDGDGGPAVGGAAGPGHGGGEPAAGGGRGGVRPPHQGPAPRRQPLALRPRSLPRRGAQEVGEPRGLGADGRRRGLARKQPRGRDLRHEAVVLRVLCWRRVAVREAGRRLAGVGQGGGEAEVGRGLAGEGARVVARGDRVRGEVLGVHLLQPGHGAGAGAVLGQRGAGPRMRTGGGGGGQGEGAGGDAQRVHELPLELVNLVTDEGESPHARLGHCVLVQELVFQRCIPLQAVTEGGQLGVLLHRLQLSVPFELGDPELPFPGRDGEQGAEGQTSGELFVFPFQDLPSFARPEI